jgi:hypothetical protein
LAELGVRLLRPARKGEPQRPGAHLFKPLRQLIESVNDTFKGQLDLERHGGRTGGRGRGPGPAAHPRPAAAIWHNHKTGQPTLRPWSPTTTDLGINHLGPFGPGRQVARPVALQLSKRPTLTPDQVKQLLVRRRDQLPM